jgi:DeoR/GlpR family transcriptional regulator of sugar metabolism
MVEVPIKRAMIEAAASVTLLADGGKFSMSGLVKVCDAGAIDHIVTDEPLPPACGPSLEDSGIEVTVA